MMLGLEIIRHFARVGKLIKLIVRKSDGIRFDRSIFAALARLHRTGSPAAAQESPKRNVTDQMQFHGLLERRRDPFYPFSFRNTRFRAVSKVPILKGFKTALLEAQVMA